jgi:D-alanine--poly(phosphoribitol) ligase subunit 1
MSTVLNLAWRFHCHAHTNPAHVALVVNERTYTYGELAAAAGRVAAWLSERRRSDGQPPRVGIFAARSFDAYAGILGTVWAGGAFIPLGVKQPADRLRSILSRTNPDAVIADPRGQRRLAELGDSLPARVLGSTTMWDELHSLPEPPAPLAVEPSDIAYIIFTSGTTGVPKGVAVSVDNVAHYLRALRALYPLGPRDRVAQFFESTFDVSVHEMFLAWDNGASLHVIPETKLMSPAGFIREHELTMWQAVPSVIGVMMRLKHLPPGSLPSLRYTQFGGEGLPVASARAWKAAACKAILDNQYGPTEATMACMYQRVGDEPIETPGRGTLAIGDPYPGMTAAVVGPDHSFLADGQTGELALSGGQVALGYFGDEALTARRFPTLDHPTLEKSRWYLTGDLAYRDPGGMYHCLGRVDNQVKVNGFRVELEEVEAHLRLVCRTDSVAAVAWPAVNGNASGIVAFVSGVELDPPAVREKLRGLVPVYMLPTRVMALENIPLSMNGKIDRKTLHAFLDRGGVMQ